MARTCVCASLWECKRESGGDMEKKKKDEETEDVKEGQTARRTTECLRK